MPHVLDFRDWWLFLNRDLRAIGELPALQMEAQYCYGAEYAPDTAAAIIATGRHKMLREGIEK